MENKKLTLAEAFQSLKSLTEDVFEVDDDGIARANSFINDDIDEETDVVIDPLAQTEDELQDSYMGKAILDCIICQSKIYKDPEEVIINEDGSLANVGEVCPYCQSSDGFKVIGQVAPYKPVEEDKVETEVEVDPDDDSVEVDIEDKEDEDLEESKKPSTKKGKSVWDKVEKYLKEDMDSKKTVDDIYLQWIADGDKWLDLVPTPKKEEDETEAFGSAFESSWNESEGGSGVTINEYGLLLPDGSEISDLDITKDKNDFIQTIRDKNLYPLFGYTKEEFEDTIKDKDIIDVITSKQINPLTTGVKSIDDHVKEFIDSWNEYIDVDSDTSLDESMENVTIETDKEKIKVTSEPKEEVEEVESTETMIAPVDETTESEFKSESEEIEDEDSDYEDIDVDEFEEESFDILGEKYLKKVYENVKSFKTTQGSVKGNSLKLEGLITFKSGKQAKTNFIFESKAIDKSGRIKLEGLNKQLAKGNKAFTLVGRMDGNKFLSESLTYNYTAKDGKSGKSIKLYDRVTK